jgi:very-short-patch-repair endonuclease
MNESERAFLALAEDQYGVASRAQAVACGMRPGTIDLRIGTGRFEMLFPAVYRISGSPRTGRQRAMAASLWLGKEGLISHRTAAVLLKLDRVRTTELHVTVPRSVRRRVSDPTMSLHRAVALPRLDRVVVDGIPCTSATRTIVDCAGLLDDEALEIAFESARRMRLTSPTALARRAGALCGSGKPGSTKIRRLLAHQQFGQRHLDSPLEVKAARLIRASSLPQPVRQLEVDPYRLDFAWSDLWFAVECEGFEIHGNRLAWKRDRRRVAALERAGWRLMIVTWDDVTRYPSETLDRIALALQRAA